MEYLQHKATFLPQPRIRLAGVLCGPALTLGQLRLLEATNSPFLLGGQPAAADCAIALYLISTPWRRARRALSRSSRRMRCWLTYYTWHLRDPARHYHLLTELDAYIKHALWQPEAYTPAPSSSNAGVHASIHPLATGLALRLALRAQELGLLALSTSLSIPSRHAVRHAVVWDLTCAEILAAGVASAEMNGSEFLTRPELEQFGQPPQEPREPEEPRPDNKNDH